MKYLAIYEAPCVGTAPEVFEADNARDADNHAWTVSCHTKEFVNGSYDLYAICYNPKTNNHELMRIDPVDE